MCLTGLFYGSQDSRGRKETIFIPLYHFHSLTSIEDDYHVFLIATLVFTRLLLDEIYRLIKLPFEWLIDDAMFVCLLDELILGFCYSDITLETGGFELTSTIILVLQANRLTKCASHRLVKELVVYIGEHIWYAGSMYQFCRLGSGKYCCLGNRK